MILHDFEIIGIFLLGTIGFAIGSLLLSKLIRPHTPSTEKQTTYECGVDTEGTSWVQFKIQYFLYALVFVAFDVETIFLYPWAVAFKRVGVFAFVDMIIFVAIVALGLWYMWKEGALEWS